jgi:thioredoxin 2
MTSAPDLGSRPVVACPSCGRRNRVPTVAEGVPRCSECHQHLPWLVEADDSTFRAVVAGRLPVLVDLWAPWCGPCRMVGPAVEEMTRRFAGRVKTVKVNVDEASAVARQLGVQSIPTLLIMRDGEEVARQVGALPAPALEKWIGGQLEVLAARSGASSAAEDVGR